MLTLRRSRKNRHQGKIKMPSQFKRSFKKLRCLLDESEGLSKRPCALTKRNSFSIPPVFLESRTKDLDRAHLDLNPREKFAPDLTRFGSALDSATAAPNLNSPYPKSTRNYLKLPSCFHYKSGLYQPSRVISAADSKDWLFGESFAF
jgi:hypothetical protein